MSTKGAFDDPAVGFVRTLPSVSDSESDESESGTADMLKMSCASCISIVSLENGKGLTWLSAVLLPLASFPCSLLIFFNVSQFFCILPPSPSLSLTGRFLGSPETLPPTHGHLGSPDVIATEELEDVTVDHHRASGGPSGVGRAELSEATGRRGSRERTRERRWVWEGVAESSGDVATGVGREDEVDAIGASTGSAGGGGGGR